MAPSEIRNVILPAAQPTWQGSLDRIVDDYFDEMVSVRRYMHAYPEPSNQEYQTTQFLNELLSGSHLQVRAGPDGRGLIVGKPQPDVGPLLALRADLDALRLQERNSLEFASRVSGIMHGCGHDIHTAILYGALSALARAEQQGVLPWPVNYRGIFQPAEETNHGAKEMIAVGALKDVRCIIGLHIDPTRPVGQIGTRIGPVTAACDSIDVLIEGEGGHAARPHEAVDPISIAAQFINAVYLNVPRTTDTQDPVVVTFGQIRGGDSPNVIPSRVTLIGTMRTLSQVIRERTREQVHQIAKGLSVASGADIQVKFRDWLDSVHNDEDTVLLIRRAAVEALGPENVTELPRASMGGEDFSNYLHHVPGAMFRLGCRGDGAEFQPLHSPFLNPDERCLSVGAKIMARTAIRWAEPSDLD